MSSNTLLDIVRTVCDELGLPRPPAVANSTDPQVRQLVALINSAGRDVAAAHTWTALQSLGTIVTEKAKADYVLAPDFDRLIADTAWDRDNKWQMCGPQTPQADRFLRESGMTAAAVRKFRLFGKTLRLWPTPEQAGHVFVYEYMSYAWALDVDGTRKDAMTVDTDTSIFEPKLLIKGAKALFMAAKGFDATSLMQDWTLAIQTEIADDNADGSINMGGVYDEDYLSDVSVVVGSSGSGSNVDTPGGGVSVPGGVAPTDIQLSSSAVSEGSVQDTVVGTLSATDLDPGDTAVFFLRDAAGDRFKIVGNELRVGPSPLSATNSPAVITIRATDSFGLSFDKQFAVSILDVNQAPTDILLSKTSVLESATLGTLVATISAVDPDPAQTFTFQIVADPDQKFVIANGNELRVKATLDYELKQSHLVTIRVTDGAGCPSTSSSPLRWATWPRRRPPGASRSMLRRPTRARPAPGP
jgi:hypothetical protein